MPELAPRAVTLSMAVGASALFFTGEARAGHEFGEIALPILTLSTVGLGGAVVGISNANYVTKGERPGTGWLVSGFVFGGLNAVAGGFFTVLMIDNRPRSAVIVVGTLAHVALATADITLSITGMSKTRGGRARLPVVPIVIPDAQGKLAFGVGLELGALWAGVPLMGWPAGLGTSQTSVADDRVRLFLVKPLLFEGPAAARAARGHRCHAALLKGGASAWSALALGSGLCLSPSTAEGQPQPQAAQAPAYDGPALPDPEDQSGLRSEWTLLPLLRFGIGPTLFTGARAPDARPVSLELLAGAGAFSWKPKAPGERWEMMLQPELGYGRDGGEQGGHRFLAGLSLSVMPSNLGFLTISYSPHLVVGGGHAGMRNGIRLSMLEVLGVEGSYNWLPGRGTESTSVRLMVTLDIARVVGGIAGLFLPKGGRPLEVEGRARVASLRRTRSWACSPRGTSAELLRNRGDQLSRRGVLSSPSAQAGEQ